MFECAICHRTSEKVQVHFCTRAGLYLCSKHKNQFYRHGQFMPDKKQPRFCDVCGKEGNTKTIIWCGQANKYLCIKHLGQFNRLGKFLEKTKRDKNDYVLHEDFAEILFRDKDQNVVGSAMIDIEDVEKCRPYKWYMTEMMGNSRYVKAVISGKNLGLHRFVLDYDGDMPIDHINRNGLDNRKSNLRIVTSSENSVNSKTRSSTGEKNIYKKNNRFQVQIIRNYQNVFIKTFDTLEEAVAARDGFIQEYNTVHGREV
jgi:hypothetical protein